MIYFIFWVVFLLLAIVAVPVAMMIEGKSRQRVALGGAYDDDSASDGAMSGDDESVQGVAGDDNQQPLDDNGDGFGAAEVVDDFGAEPLGGGEDFGGDFGGGDLGADDLGAFDEELK